MTEGRRPAAQLHTSAALPDRSGTLNYVVAGASLLAYAVLLSFLSFQLRSESIERERALLWLAVGGVAAGAVYLAALFNAHRTHFQPAARWLVAVTVLARLIVCVAPPMLESDYQRYLWDGAVSASGLNPYRHAPSDVIARSVQGPDADPLAVLADRSGPVLSNVNHPALTTLYPPVAQAAFAAAFSIAPFSPSGLRIVFCIADVATILLLARLLRALALPASQLAWFAWNPLLLREIYSSLHMDILILPLITASLLMAFRAKGGLAAAWLMIATAVKVWPIVLLPLLARPMLGTSRRVAMTLAVCAALSALLWFPVLLAPQGENSGLLAYGSSWQSNDGYFRAGIWLTERVLTMFSIAPWHSHGILRVVSAALLGGVVLWQLRTRPKDAAELVARCLFIVGAIFMLSPTQFPWYWLWCLPLLSLRPSLPLLLYTALLPLFYVKDVLAYPLSHWLQHAPVWILLVAAAARLRLGQVAHATRPLGVSRA